MATEADDWMKRRAHAMGEVMNHIFYRAQGIALQYGHSGGEEFDSAVSAGCECIASQLNVLAHYYGQVRLKAEPDSYGGSSHYDFVAELLEDITRRALARHLTPGERGLA